MNKWTQTFLSKTGPFYTKSSNVIHSLLTNINSINYRNDRNSSEKYRCQLLIYLTLYVTIWVNWFYKGAFLRQPCDVLTSVEDGRRSR